jgi:hypothetical protein
VHKATRPDLEVELSRLKGFQRDSVEYVFQRLYRDQPCARRFLVADEVGLGKTMVARGVIAKALNELWDRADVQRIDVIYICSNGNIARQNINRLNVTEAKDAALPSRITLLPKVVRGLQHRKVNFISLTPQTSFDLRSSLGTYEERALLHRLLPGDWTSEKGSRNALQGFVDRDRFHRHIDELRAMDLDTGLARAFHEQLGTHVELAGQFKQLCERFTGFRSYDSLSEEDRSKQRELVGRLRLELATSCLRALEPDLIIVDEFQRFKYLLDGTDPAGELAHDLFSFGDARVLLLSATPYKMYTTGDEQLDDHYRDFLQTVEFLQTDKTATAGFKESLEEYRRAIFRLGDGVENELRHGKDRVEQELKRVMVRTERLAVQADRNGMLAEVPSARVQMAQSDVDIYLATARIARAIEHHDVIEYWKSAPYLLNFMDDYQLKESFVEALADKNLRSQLSDPLRSHPACLLDWSAVEDFLALDPPNGRMRALVSDLLDGGAWRLLWLPPALPYYQLAPPYADVDAERLTKRLIFSSWHVVPKAVAALLSYEAERRMAGAVAGDKGANTVEGRRKRQGELRFSRGPEGAPASMSALGMLYPGIVLAEAGDPLAIARQQGKWPSYEAVLADAERHVREALEGLPAFREATDSVDDKSWYWAASILLDLHRHPDATRAWLRQSDLAGVWTNTDGDDTRIEAEADGAEDAWSGHVAEAQRLSAGDVWLGRPPDDLARVLATMALGAPGPVALRALARISGGSAALGDRHLRNEAGWIAWAFRSLFNLPEVATLIRSLNDAEPYWLRVAEYCAGGGLQAVLDEYAHVLLEHEGVGHKPVTEATRRIAKVIANALQLRTANVGVDEIVLDDGGPRVAAKRHMRARFAARFGAKQTDEGAGAIRQDDVRTAFNSPFWPFVLCSTSVGQEGLDFHLYCHAVVHWNLPSNPVDLEQREGRVHRYKGHAVRKNVVRQLRDHVLAGDDPDPWESLFHRAVVERPSSESDLVPFWVLPVEGGAKIERHVPALPLSREEGQLTTLRSALTVYRMAFGQNRQEDVIAYLQKKCSPELLEHIASALRVDLSPPKANAHQAPVIPRRRVAVRTVNIDEPAGDSALRYPTVDVRTARELLDLYRDCAALVAAPPIHRYVELLDEYARRARLSAETV